MPPGNRCRGKQPVDPGLRFVYGNRKVQLGNERLTQTERACKGSNAFMRSDNNCTLVKRMECQQNNRLTSTSITVNASFMVPSRAAGLRSVSHQRKSVSRRSRPQSGRNKTYSTSEAFSAQRRSTAQPRDRDPEVSADPGWYRVCCRADCRAVYPLILVVVISVDAGTHERSLARQLDRGRMCLQSESIAFPRGRSRSTHPRVEQPGSTFELYSSCVILCHDPDHCFPSMPFSERCCLHRSQVSKNAKSKQTADSARPVSTDATASYSQGITLSKNMGYKPQEQTAIERYLMFCIQTLSFLIICHLQTVEDTNCIPWSTDSANCLAVLQLHAAPLQA